MLDRREFCMKALKLGGSLCLASMPLSALINQARVGSQWALRPPAAVDEADFLSSCIHCGLCVRDCPYDVLALSTDSSPAFGTPYFTPRTKACELCEDMPCVKACPTSALDQNMTDINQAKMGTAVLVDQEHCLAFLGLRCEVCFRACPVQGKAITLEKVENQRTHKHVSFLPTVHAEFCTGCGKCEEACILPVGGAAAIQVLPTHIARTSLASHYRLGWEEKNKNNDQSLVPNTIDLPNRVPDETIPQTDNWSNKIEKFQP